MHLGKNDTQVIRTSRRQILKHTTLGALSLGVSAAYASDRYSLGASPIRYPDPDIIALDKKRFKYRIGNAVIKREYTGMRWAEGPAWNGVGKYLVWSDIASNQQLRLTTDNQVISNNFRTPSNYSNGNTFDQAGRQIVCEHLNQRVVRYEANGTTTVLADQYNGVRFNAPNDVVVSPLDDSIWFTDPGYGSMVEYEGSDANNGSPQPYQKEAVFRIDSKTGKLTKVTDEIFKPNGLCFSADYKKLYVVDSGNSHYSQAKGEIKVWDVVGEKLANGKHFAFSALKKQNGSFDGIRCDEDGNLWAGAGWGGEGFDGVHILAPDGDRIGQILLPETCSNVCFGGLKRNQLFMTASQSLYSVFVNVKGAHFC